MSLNPIQFAKDVVDQYGRYLMTNFPIANESIREQVHRKLRHGVGGEQYLSKGPYIYLSRPFERGPTLDELLTDERLNLHRGVKTVFPFERLHKHQELAIHSITQGYHTVIAAGTGSGKTESFLIPIVDYCLKLGEDDPGVVAVLVYPMNALVNDQLKRLRTILAGTGVTFGRYTGETKDKTPDTLNRLKSRAPYTPAQKEELKINPENVPLPWEECFSEDEIRKKKPRILLTNYKQLEYLLLRDKDIDLFRDAPVKFIVFDEVHTYTGIMGSETACLIRRLKNVTGHAEDIICIGTSATVASERPGLGVEDIVKPFAYRLFGVPSDKTKVVTERFIKSSGYPRESYYPIPTRNPRELMDEILSASREVQKMEEAGELSGELLKLTLELTGQQEPHGDTNVDKIYDILSRNRFIQTMTDVFTKPTIFDRSIKRFQALKGQERYERDEIAAQIISYLTLGALVHKDGGPLLRPKLHYFIQGLQGIWVTPERDGWKVLFSESSDEYKGKLILPVKLCKACGQHYFQVIASDPPQVSEINGIETSFRTIRSAYKNAVVLAGELEYYITDEITSHDEDIEGENIETLYMCTSCGTLHSTNSLTCANESCGKKVELMKVYAWQDEVTKCRACGNQKVGRNPVIRKARSGEVADVMVLAQTMLSTMAEEEFRKLLIFTDNRQDAAYQAAWMEERSRRFRLRHLLVQTLRENPDRIWSYESLIDELNTRAMDQKIFTGGAYRREENRKKAAWFIDEDFASTQQRRSSIENLGLAMVHYEDLENRNNDEFIIHWSKVFHIEPNEVINTIRILIDYYRRRGVLNEPLLMRDWTPNDKEVFTGMISVADHYAPRVLLPTTISDRSIRKYTLTWRSERGQAGSQQIMNKAISHGEEEVDNFLKKLFEWLKDNRYIVRSSLNKKVHGKIITIRTPAEAYQINYEKVGIRASTVRHFCSACRRNQSIDLPTYKCPEWRCLGKTEILELDDNNYDIHQYTRLHFVPLKTYEHSAQVPKEMREKVEREFKRPEGEYNCIVCTPTLELGVDIGQLEMAIMRNVPPTPANYSQRAGRAGRRHRIAVVFTYSRGTQHDRYFFKDPPAMITGDIRVPVFSMRNLPLLKKHIHSATLTKLRELVTLDEKNILDQSLPTYISDYLGFYPRDNVERVRFRQYKEPKKLDDFTQLISKYNKHILNDLKVTFQTQWPEDDTKFVSSEILENFLDNMPELLQQHVNRLYNHFDTYTRIIKNYADIESRNEALTKEETRERVRFQQSRNWFLDKANRETYTLSYLCDDGFLPGYALGRDSCLAQAFGDPFFEITRPPTIALREFTPSNWIYANKNIFKVQRLNFYKFSQESTSKENLSISVGLNLSKGTVFDPKSNELEGGEDELDTFTSYELTELELKKLQSIDDKSEARRYIGFEIQGLLLKQHKGGYEGTIAEREFLYLDSEHIRIINLGPKRLVARGRYGFPICPACGETRNPEASDIEIDNFTEHHKKYCKIENIVWASIHVELESDVIILRPFEEHRQAVNVIEALRIGAKEVLDMTNSDIDGFITLDEREIYNAIIFDPMPGGSGFLPQILNLWNHIVETSINILKKCECETSCYSCLRHFRNQQHHDELDRNLAIHLLTELTGEVKKTNPIPARFIDKKLSTDMADSPPEVDFISTLELHQFPLPEKHHKFIPQEEGLSMEADYYYPNEKVIVLIDGLSRKIHGDPKRRQKDQLQRAKARMKGYKVLELSAQSLKDETYIRGKLQELAIYLERDDLVDE